MPLSNHRTEVEATEQWRELSVAMPYLSFPETFEVCIIPPYSGATARFLVRNKGANNFVSVYCDHFNALGFMDAPYWEALLGDDTERFMLGEETELVSAIKTYLTNEKFV